MLSQQIKIFLQVVDSGSFSKAAKILYVTPASIMKHMNTLEDRLGLTLLKRTNQGIVLTAAGKSLYEDGKRILEETNIAISKAKGAELTNKSIIKVGSSLLNPSHVLSDLWISIKDKYPQFRLSIVPYDDTKEQILSVVASLGEKIDIMIGSFNSKKMFDNANFLKLGNYKLCVAVPNDHKLATKNLITFNDLHGEHLMMVKSGDTELLDNFQNMLKMTHPQIFLEEADYYYDIDTFNYCEQHGIALLTLDAWATIHPSLVTLPLDYIETVEYGILYPLKPSEEILNFIHIIEKEFL